MFSINKHTIFSNHTTQVRIKEMHLIKQIMPIGFNTAYVLQSLLSISLK